MKKIRAFFLVLSIVFLILGTAIQLYIRFNNNSYEKSKEKEISVDVLDADTFEDLEKYAKETEIGIESDEFNEKVFYLNGYMFNGMYVNLSVDINEKKEISKFEGLIEPFNRSVDHTADDFRQKCESSIKAFVQRFGVESNGYTIHDQETGNQLDNNDIESFKAIDNQKAYLDYYIKDKKGFIWIFNASNGYFNIIKIMDSEITKDMHYDIDLSQTTTEGQGE